MEFLFKEIDVQKKGFIVRIILYYINKIIINEIII